MICPDCPFDTDDALELMAHTKAKHNHGITVTCDHCGTRWGGSRPKGKGCEHCSSDFWTWHYWIEETAA